jgi:hypothetical protein
MIEYKLYFLDHRGRIARRHDIVAADDAAAAEQARAHANGTDCELWSGTRKVATLPLDAPPVWMGDRG